MKKCLLFLAVAAILLGCFPAMAGTVTLPPKEKAFFNAFSKVIQNFHAPQMVEILQVHDVPGAEGEYYVHVSGISLAGWDITSWQHLYPVKEIRYFIRQLESEPAKMNTEYEYDIELLNQALSEKLTELGY